MHADTATLLFVALAGLVAGTQNTLAGGGSFITFPTLMLAGLNPLAANVTSTIALYPNQLTSAWAGRKIAGGVETLSLRALFIISLAGGVCGAFLLLMTPVSIFASIVPWLILFATCVFAWGSFRKKPLHAASSLPNVLVGFIQFMIAIYGGYFGGGIGFLMLAMLTIAGQKVHMAGASKNVLSMAMNTSAVAIFMTSSQVNWTDAFALAAGGVAGAILGSWLMNKLPERLLRGFIVVLGFALTIWMFYRQ